MKSVCPGFPPWLLLLSLWQPLVGCHQEDQPAPPPLPRHNTFSMTLNGAAWQPSQLGSDTCARTYKAEWAEVTTARGKRPYYTISAYRDPQGIATPNSEQALKLRFTEVLSVGLYPITGSYQRDFESFALFTRKQADGTMRRYVNPQGKATFRVEVTEFIALPVPGVAAQGVKGTFHGTLYNETNPFDSLTISRGAFTFRLLNTDVPRYNQCQ